MAPENNVDASSKRLDVSNEWYDKNRWKSPWKGYGISTEDRTSYRKYIGYA